MKEREPVGFYGRKEEMINAITHWAGVVLGIVGLVFLLIPAIREQSTIKITAFAVYGACFIAMYGCSALYHTVQVKKIKSVLRVFDHSSIFLFIAGTYTPVLLLSLKGTFRIVMMVLVWGIAIFGIVFKIVTFGKFQKYGKVSLALYLGLGWLSVLLIPEILRTTSLSFLIYLILGGVIYSLGTIFYSNPKIPYHHAIWHLFVLGASIIHYIAIFNAYA